MSHMSETYGRLPGSLLLSVALLRLSSPAMPPLPRTRTISAFAGARAQGAAGRGAASPKTVRPPARLNNNPDILSHEPHATTAKDGRRAPEARRRGARRGAPRGHRLCHDPHGQRRRRPLTRPTRSPPPPHVTAAASIPVSGSAGRSGNLPPLQPDRCEPAGCPVPLRHGPKHGGLPAQTRRAAEHQRTASRRRQCRPPPPAIDTAHFECVGAPGAPRATPAPSSAPVLENVQWAPTCPAVCPKRGPAGPCGGERGPGLRIPRAGAAACKRPWPQKADQESIGAGAGEPRARDRDRPGAFMDYTGGARMPPFAPGEGRGLALARRPARALRRPGGGRWILGMFPGGEGIGRRGGRPRRLWPAGLERARLVAAKHVLQAHRGQNRAVLRIAPGAAGLAAAVVRQAAGAARSH